MRFEAPNEKLLESYRREVEAALEHAK